MKFLKFLFIAAVLASTATSLNAQEQAKRSPEERATLHTERMTKQLALTPEQQSKVTDLNMGIAKKNEAVRNNVNMTPEQKQEAIKGNMEARNNILKTILTAEQYEKLLQHQDMRKEKGDKTLKKEQELKGSKQEGKPEDEL